MKTTKIAALGGLALAGTIGGVLWAQSAPKPQTPQQLLGQVRAHYQELSSFSMQVTHQYSSEGNPSADTQQLRWRRGGRFDLHNISLGGVARPDIYADGSQVVSVLPSGQRKTEALTLPPNRNPVSPWPAAGEILLWLQSSPLGEQPFRPQPKNVATWQFGPRTSWHGQKAKEVRLKGLLPGRTGQVSFFVDEAAQTLIGVEASQPDGKRWDDFYTDQKENPPLPATLGSAP